MNSKLFLPAAAVLLVLFFGYFSIGESVQAQSGFVIPPRLVLNGIGEPVDSTEGTVIAPLTESFYPIGWSKDGKFAYYTEPADEACGCYFAKLVIQDMRTDKILWEYSYNGEENAEETISSHWYGKKQEFVRKLKRFGIRQQNDFALLFPNFEHKGDTFEPRLDSEIHKDVEFTDGAGEFYVGTKGSLKLSMYSARKGSKIIYRKRLLPVQYERIQDAEVSGVLKSPFESRVAVILVELHRGYEGPPHKTSIRVVGSNLTTRFR